MNNKVRILRLARMFYRLTDINHPMTMGDIREYLRAQGCVVDRHTLTDDIKVLSEEGIEIEHNRTSRNEYYLENRLFEVPELRILLDAVASYRFISPEKSNLLAQKIKSLTSEYNEELLTYDASLAEKIRTDNRKIYYIVDKVGMAIHTQRKITFQYYEYNADKEKVLRNNGEWYTISPYHMIINDNHYYMIGYSDKRQAIVHFRLDRMSVPEVLEEAAEKKASLIDVHEYISETFGMFIGEEHEVVMECDNKLMKSVIDQFGENIDTWKVSDERFCMKVRVKVSQTFYAWVFQFKGGIKIISPDYIKEEYKTMLNEAVKDV